MKPWSIRVMFSVKMKYIFLVVYIVYLLRRDTCYCLNEDKHYWYEISNEDIEKAIGYERNDNFAKNVIIFVADGMGLTTSTASRIYGKGEKGFLAFDRFPHLGLIKTYSANKLVPDSCTTATALFCGVKANHKTAGVDGTVQHGDCAGSLEEAARLESIFTWAQREGIATGFVTNTRVTHATPSPLYSHTADRDWECEAKMPDSATPCKDIARQLVEDRPGRDINVIFGGGRQCLQSEVMGSPEDPVDTWSCYSKDGRDLIRDWREDKVSRSAPFEILSNNRDLEKLDLRSEFVLGIFANGHIKMEHLRDKGPEGMPSLSDMTEKAIRLLEKNEKGYILVVEGGLIDFGHHRGHAKQALNEVVAFSDAIERALLTIQGYEEDTLVIVTSDHSHSLVFTGYADRGTSITGVAQKSKTDGSDYTSLLYGTGGPNNYQFSVKNGSAIRRDPAEDDVDSFEYSQQAVVSTDEVAHGGADVLVYARGPKSYLFHSVHEQTHVAYVVAYAMKIGPYSGDNLLRSPNLHLIIIEAILSMLLLR